MPKRFPRRLLTGGREFQCRCEVLLNVVRVNHVRERVLAASFGVRSDETGDGEQLCDALPIALGESGSAYEPSIAERSAVGSLLDEDRELQAFTETYIGSVPSAFSDLELPGCERVEVVDDGYANADCLL